MAELICHVTLIFSPCCHTAAYVALGLVDVKKLTHLRIKRGIYGAESFRKVLVYCAFGNAELLCRGTYRTAVFDDIHSNVAGAFFDICMHVHHSPYHVVNLYEDRGEDIP